MDLLDDLRWRGLVYDQTEGLAEFLKQQKRRIYTGFDPTGESLHVGSLVPIICLARLQRAGHAPIALAGGGTGLIGDPSGKIHERQLLTREQVQHNLDCIQSQLACFLDFETKTNPAVLINNADWLDKMSILDFLRDIGKHFTVNYMMAKESVRSRIDREDGISFTEFSYMLLQAYDFHHLHEHYGCEIQAGGSDQWGNITSGIELIRRLRGGKAYGLVYPLITKSDGSKFGKTESGNIWLDANKTSPYQFYQFWLNTADDDVVQYLKWFTFLSHNEIDELENTVIKQPEKRRAQQTLAKTMTAMLHGESEAKAAEHASAAMFNKDLDFKTLDAKTVAQMFADAPTFTAAKQDFEGEGKTLVQLLKESGLTPSTSEAMRMVKQGAVRINNQRVSDKDHKVDLDQSIDGKYVLLQCGKKKKCLVKIRS